MPGCRRAHLAAASEGLRRERHGGNVSDMRWNTQMCFVHLNRCSSTSQLISRLSTAAAASKVKSPKSRKQMCVRGLSRCRRGDATTLQVQPLSGQQKKFLLLVYYFGFLSLWPMLSASLGGLQPGTSDEPLPEFNSAAQKPLDCHTHFIL